MTGSLAVVGTPVQDWTRSRFEAAMVVIFAMVAALGLTAIIVAVRTARAPSVMR